MDDLERRPSHAGRAVLVTGAGRGIGAAIAAAFGRRGAKVGVVDVDAALAESVAKAIRDDDDGGDAAAVASDVADYAQLEAAVETLQAVLGQAFDTLVNNAGISPKHDGRPAPIWAMEPEEWRRVVGVNLDGCFNAIRLLSPAMRAAGHGAIVNMSSVAGRTYSPIVAAHYAATKAALIGLTKHAAAELGPFNVRVNAIAPGRIETPMVLAVGQAVNDEQVRLTPMARLGHPDEVADLALYLTSDEASFVTGQTVDVAGGLYMT